MRFPITVFNHKWLSLVVFLLFLQSSNPITAQDQNETLIYTRIIEVTPSVSNYSVVDVDTNDTYHYTVHSFYLIGQYLNLGNNPYNFNGQTNCDGSFRDFFSLLIIETNSDFVTPYSPPITLACFNTVASSNMVVGLTQVSTTITLYTSGNTTNFANGIFSFKLHVSGGNHSPVEITPTTITIDNDQIQIEVDYPSVWDDYPVTNSFEQGDNTMEIYFIPYPFGFFLVGTFISLKIYRYKLKL